MGAGLSQFPPVDEAKGAFHRHATNGSLKPSGLIALMDELASSSLPDDETVHQWEGEYANNSSKNVFHSTVLEMNLKAPLEWFKIEYEWKGASKNRNISLKAKLFREEKTDTKTQQGGEGKKGKKKGGKNNRVTRADEGASTDSLLASEESGCVTESREVCGVSLTDTHTAPQQWTRESRALSHTEDSAVSESDKDGSELVSAAKPGDVIKLVADGSNGTKMNVRSVRVRIKYLIPEGEETSEQYSDIIKARKDREEKSREEGRRFTALVFDQGRTAVTWDEFAGAYEQAMPDCYPKSTAQGDNTHSSNSSASSRTVNPAHRTGASSAFSIQKLRKHLIWFYPLLTVAFTWYFALNTEKVVNAMGGPVTSVTYKDLLPPVPETRAQAFVLGGIHESYVRLNATLAAGKGQEEGIRAEMQSLLQQAAQVAKVKAESLTERQLVDMYKRIEEVEGERGIIQRVVGFFTFVNIMWCFAILGITISVGPAVAYVVGPFIMKLVSQILLPLIVDVLIPLLLRLKPLYEITGYLVIMWITGTSGRYPPETGIFFAATACGLLIPMMFATAKYHGDDSGNVDVFMQLLFGSTMLCLIPQAVLYNSSLLGFFAVAQLYACLGFSVIPFGLCWCIGWRNEDRMVRTSATSIIIIVLLLCLRFTVQSQAAAGVMDVSLQQMERVVQPFASGLMVLGAITYFLAGLIMSARYRYNITMSELMGNNVRMIVSLILAFFLGTQLGSASLTNTAITFAVLYVSEKSLELPGARSGGGFWLWFLCISIGMWRAALWLHAHPDFVVSLFDGADVL
eukprot:GDKI01003198.1.p1 GENE.GDKI01003198.1~~GDKI01003198.1.p1  ORF type:complete len:799 (-),score=318.95 GDKI01003198.1:198-2594(-)